jgi:ElaB/YqjD/DUF883 family membrane-anchored ribosome-binding protein
MEIIAYRKLRKANQVSLRPILGSDGKFTVELKQTIGLDDKTERENIVQGLTPAVIEDNIVIIKQQLQNGIVQNGQVVRQGLVSIDQQIENLENSIRNLKTTREQMLEDNESVIKDLESLKSDVEVELNLAKEKYEKELDAVVTNVKRSVESPTNK